MFLGPIAGVMMADFWVLRSRQLSLSFPVQTSRHLQLLPWFQSASFPGIHLWHCTELGWVGESDWESECPEGCKLCLQLKLAGRNSCRVCCIYGGGEDLADGGGS